jgi:hypothetical protein
VPSSGHGVGSLRCGGCHAFYYAAR